MDVPLKEKAHSSWFRPAVRDFEDSAGSLSQTKHLTFTSLIGHREKLKRSILPFYIHEETGKSSQLEYIKDLFSCWLQGCDRPPAEGLLTEMYVERTVTANSRFLASFGQSSVQ